ncbi:MAG: ABC transporter permease, partial [Devosia sp.]|nr:ABC transporter permease [Devosia sp.]
MLFPSRLFPSPLAVGAHVVDLALNGKLLPDLGKTLSRAAVAFVVAMALGTAAGIALGRSRVADRLFSAWVVVGLNIPAIVIAIVL